MKKKILSVVLAVTMAGTMLAGCGAKIYCSGNDSWSCKRLKIMEESYV